MNSLARTIGRNQETELGGKTAGKGESKVRLMKTFGLAALAALAAMAVLGAGTASADEDTAVCKVHEEPCAEENLVKLLDFHLTEGEIGELLNDTADILCLEVLGTAHIHEPFLAEAPDPLGAVILVEFDDCGTNAAHDNCTIKSEEDGLAELLKTALNLGVLAGTAGQPGVVNVQCTILGFPVNCDYSGEELEFPVEGALHKGDSTGHGMLTATETPAKLTEALGGFFCPENSTLDGLLEPLEHVYIVG